MLRMRERAGQRRVQRGRANSMRTDNGYVSDNRSLLRYKRSVVYIICLYVRQHGGYAIGLPLC